MLRDPVEPMVNPDRRWTVWHVCLGGLILVGAVVLGRWFGHELPRLEV